MKFKRPIKILAYTLVTLLLLLVIGVFALNLPATQRWLTPKLENFLSEKLKTRVEIEHIGVRFPKAVELGGVRIWTPGGDSLLQLGSLVVDVDLWALKDSKLVLRKIGLENTDLRLSQKDGVSNYQFIIDAFAVAPTPDSLTVVDTTQSSFAIVLKGVELDLKNVALDWQNHDDQQFINAKVGDLELDLNDGDIEKLHFDVDKLLLSNTDISFRDLGPPSTDTTAASIFSFLLKEAEIEKSHIFFETADLKLNAVLTKTNLGELAATSDVNGLALKAKELDLKNADLAFQQKTAKPTPGSFNAGDFDLRNLNAKLQDFEFVGDQIKVNVESLSGTDKSGLAIQNLSGNLDYTPAQLNLQDLDLQANTTNLKGSVILKFDTTAQAVMPIFEAKLSPSQGTIADLLRFLPLNPALSDFKKMGATKWSIQGNLQGDLNALQANNFRLSIGKNTRIATSGTLRQLNDLNRLGGNLQVTELRFDKDDFTPYLKGKNMVLPAFATLSGNVNGNAGNLKLNLRGTVGNLDSLAYAPVRSDTTSFDLSGTVSGLASPNSMRMDLNIQQLEARGRQFTNFTPKNITLPERITASGTLKGSLANLQTDLKLLAQRGGASSNLKLKGTLTNLQTPDKLGFDVAFEAELTKQEIGGYVPDSILNQFLDLPAKFALDGKAKGKADDLTASTNLNFGALGKLAVDGSLKGKAYTAKLTGNSLKVNQLTADSLVPQLTDLNLTAEVKGEGFEFTKTANAEFKGEISSMVWDSAKYEEITLDGQLQGEKLKAKILSQDYKMHMRLLADVDFSTKVPQLKYDGKFDCIDFQAMKLTAKPTVACFNMTGTIAGFSLDTMDLNLALSGMQVQYDTVQIRPEDLAMTAALHNDDNDIKIVSEWLNASLTGHFDLVNLPDFVTEFEEFYFQTKPASQVAARRVGTEQIAFKLDLDQPGLIRTGIIPSLTEMGKLSMEGNFNGQTHVFDFKTNLPSADYDVWTVNDLSFSADGDGKTAKIDLKIPDLRKYGEALASDFELFGTANGKRADIEIVAKDSLQKDKFKVGVFAETNDFADGYSIHFNQKQTINYNEWTVPADNAISFKGDLVSIKNLHLASGEQLLKLDGNTRLKAGSSPAMDFSLVTNHLNLNNFDPFLIGVLSNMEGWMDADIKIGGTVKSPKPTGSLGLKQTKMTIAMTKVRYALNDLNLSLGPNGVEIPELRLTDPQGDYLTLKGTIRTSNWSDYRFDLNFSSKEWQVLNTTAKDGQPYYGKLSATVNGTIRGPLTQPEINLTVSPNEGSSLTYVYDVASNKAGGNGLVVFKKPPGQDDKNLKPIKKPYPFHLNLNLDMSEDLELNVITDPATGDNFLGSVEGLLSLEIFPDGKMNLAGRADVKNGTYRFTYQTIVKRVFKVSSDSYLSWTGDPTNPELAVTARFVVRTTPYPLLAASGSTSSTDDAAQRDYQTFFLNFRVTGNAVKPDLAIELQYPDNDLLKAEGELVNNSGSSEIESAVANINADQAQLSQQVFGLLIFQQFVGDSGGATYAGPSALERGLSSFLTQQFNALAGQYIKFVDVSLTVNEDATYGGDDTYVGSTNYNLNLQKGFLNNRLVFKVSGGATEEHGDEGQVRSSLNNASVEYLLDPKGKLKVRAFTEDGLEILNSTSSGNTNNIRNNGAGLIYTVEFKRLFKRKKK